MNFFLLFLSFSFCQTLKGMTKIISVVGARPNFMKIAPFIRAVSGHNAENPGKQIFHKLVHTGQHYDERMSDNFFTGLGIPAPDINLGVGSGTHAEQVGKTMIEFEKVLRSEKPDWVVVVGDVNATLACSVTAKKENVNCCHIEAGLRSGDMTMPEEINRIVTDRVSDLLLVPDEISRANLLSEGVPEKRIVSVGNIMIDTLDDNIGSALKLSISGIIKENSLFHPDSPVAENEDFAFITLHRPSNVDNNVNLAPLVDFIINTAAERLKIVWPLHPRTGEKLKVSGLLAKLARHRNIQILNPVSYREALKLNASAKVVLTDSGGLQEECTVLGTPCITLRYNTERPVTLRENGGTSVLAGNNVDKIAEEFLKSLSLPRKSFRPPLWDGKTAGRCVKAIVEYKFQG